MAISDKGGNVVYRFVYDTYGELSDIQNGNKVSLKTAEEASEYTPAELADAAGIEYLYNGKYGVTTDSNGLYYMRARYYDQDIKRFINRDVLSGDITNSQSLNRYCYVQGNPVSLTDPFGLCPTAEEIAKIRLRRAVHTSLDIIGLVFDEADIFNAIVYAIEGDYVDAAWSLLFTIPAVGSIIGLPFKYVFKLGGNAAEGLAKFTKKNAPELAESFGKLKRNAGGKLDDAWKWISKKFEKTIGESNVETEAFDYYMDLVETLDVSTNPNTAVFYSGPGNRTLAEIFAKENGKVTLEMTPGGAYLDGLKLFEVGSPLTEEEATNVWARLSARYAQNASGNAYGFVNGSWSGSIFNTVEYPELLKNPDISNVFTEFMK